MYTRALYPARPGMPRLLPQNEGEFTETVYLFTSYGARGENRMRQRSTQLTLALLALAGMPSAEQVLAHGSADAGTADNDGRTINFPDLPGLGLHTLVADLHTHSVFSDGHVWPKIRVAEAR